MSNACAILPRASLKLTASIISFPQYVLVLFSLVAAISAHYTVSMPKEEKRSNVRSSSSLSSSMTPDVYKTGVGEVILSTELVFSPGE